MVAIDQNSLSVFVDCEQVPLNVLNSNCMVLMLEEQNKLNKLDISRLVYNHYRTRDFPRKFEKISFLFYDFSNVFARMFSPRQNQIERYKFCLW